MNKWKIVSLIVGLFIYLPIWFYLIYTLLKHAEVDRLVWFLFYTYIPVTILLQIISKVVEND